MLCKTIICPPLYSMNLYGWPLCISLFFLSIKNSHLQTNWRLTTQVIIENQIHVSSHFKCQHCLSYVSPFNSWHYWWHLFSTNTEHLQWELRYRSFPSYLLLWFFFILNSLVASFPHIVALDSTCLWKWPGNIVSLRNKNADRSYPYIKN